MKKIKKLLSIFMSLTMIFSISSVADILSYAAVYTYDPIYEGSSYYVYLASGGSTSYYTFTPTVSGTYIFYTTGSSDTYGILGDSSRNTLTSNDDGGTNRNYKMTYYCTKGTSYTLASRHYSSTSSGSFYINVSHNCSDNYTNTVTKATTSANGKSVNKCNICGSSYTVATYYYPKTVNLSKTTYTYNGSSRKPTVTVKDSNGNTISSSNYTVTYASGRKKVGKYKVTIKFKGNYSGTVTKYFKIKPKATSITSITANSKGFTVQWKKITTQTTGYQVQYSTNKNFSNAKTATCKSNSKKKGTAKNLKAKKKYYVRVRTYKTVNGTKYYSSWSNVETVKTKK